MIPATKSRALYENLDTSFVNLWALLRHLSQRGFIGRVRVEMKDYTADVFLTRSNVPLVHEVDRAAGTDKLEESALHRLVLRVRESPGTIDVFEGEDEAVPAAGAAQISKADTNVLWPTPASAKGEPIYPEDSAAIVEPPIAAAGTKEASEWAEVMQVSSELIAGVERSVNSAGADFASLFRTVRLELADDYPFLDPMKQHFQYASAVATLRDEIAANVFVTGVSEVLRRVVDKVAVGERARRVRERVALDLALIARKRIEALKRSGFGDQLDRIAGTKVI